MGTPSGLGNCWRGPSVPLVASGGLFLALLVATADAFGAPPLPDTQPAVVAAAPDGDLVARGRSLFVAKGCVACHSIAGVPGSAQVGPNLTALPSVAPLRQPGLAAADYVREALVSPQ